MDCYRSGMACIEYREWLTTVEPFCQELCAGPPVVQNAGLSGGSLILCPAISSFRFPDWSTFPKAKGRHDRERLSKPRPVGGELYIRGAGYYLYA